MAHYFCQRAIERAMAYFRATLSSPFGGKGTKDKDTFFKPVPDSEIPAYLKDPFLRFKNPLGSPASLLKETGDEQPFVPLFKPVPFGGRAITTKQTLVALPKPVLMNKNNKKRRIVKPITSHLSGLDNSDHDTNNREREEPSVHEDAATPITEPDNRNVAPSTGSTVPQTIITSSKEHSTLTNSFVTRKTKYLDADKTTVNLYVTKEIFPFCKFITGQKSGVLY